MTNKAYIGAIIIVAAGLVVFVLGLPTYDHIVAVKAAINDRNQLLADRAQILSTIKDLNDQYTKRAADINRFQYIIPATKSTPEIVSMMQAISSQNGLQLFKMQLGEAQTNLAQAQYNVQNVELNLMGNYPAFRNFLDSLEKNIRVFDITSIQGSPVGTELTTIVFTVKGSVYFLK